MKLSIVIVNYNNPELTEQTLSSIRSSKVSFPLEVILADNSSDPEKKYQLKDGETLNLKLVHCENKGFGNGCNVGAGQAAGEYLLMLNSDTILEEDTLQQTMDFTEGLEADSIVGIRTLLKDGQLDKGCKRGFPTPLASLAYFTGLDRAFPGSRSLGAYQQTFIPEHQTAEVDCISGAFMWMRKETYDFLGGFDEAFFMHGEDIDLCYRAKEKGIPVVYHAATFMTHLKGQSSMETNSLLVLKNLYQSMWRFYRKHYYHEYPKLVGLLVYGGIKAKYGISYLKARWKA